MNKESLIQPLASGQENRYKCLSYRNCWRQLEAEVSESCGVKRLCRINSDIRTTHKRRTEKLPTSCLSMSSSRGELMKMVFSMRPTKHQKVSLSSWISVSSGATRSDMPWQQPMSGLNTAQLSRIRLRRQQPQTSQWCHNISASQKKRCKWPQQNHKHKPLSQSPIQPLHSPAKPNVQSHPNTLRLFFPFSCMVTNFEKTSFAVFRPQ